MIVGGLAAVGLAVVALVAFGLMQYAEPPPDFPALVDDPDPTLEGSVAYVDSASQCVRVRAVAGRPDQEVYCFEPGAPYDLDWTTLAWLADGRLEITTHSWPPKEDIAVDSQRIVDVRTGDVDEVPTDELPEPRTPDHESGPKVNSRGEELTVDNDGSRAALLLSDEASTRTLIEGSGNPEYEFRDQLWGPDESWALVDDGRLLLVTIGDEPTARILLDQGVRGFSAGARGWAVTGADVLDDAEG